MGKRIRHHVNPLRSEFLKRQSEPLALPTTPTPIDVELGCADARFLFELAPQFPDRHHLGLEIREPLVEEVNEKARALGLHNLEARFAHINVELDALFPDGRLARVFINFPDPWFKRRHHKRRLVTPELIEVIHRKLAAGGELFFQSDVWDLALDALAVIEGAPALFTNVAGPWTFLRENPYSAKSLREVRCEERGMRIWRMLYRRV
jgi:tRNA (guanine-N7-)-methyltransferase